MKNCMRIARAGTVAGLVCLFATLYATAAGLEYRKQPVSLEGGVVQQANVPAGYTLELLTTHLVGPRMLTFAANGDLFIGSQSGKVYRLPPPYTQPKLLVTLDGYPHSVALRDG